MAEVRKAVREDKYGTAKIKKETKEKAKSEKKAVKKNNKRNNNMRFDFQSQHPYSDIVVGIHQQHEDGHLNIALLRNSQCLLIMFDI